jgi:protein-disulfide isomerase
MIINQFYADTEALLTRYEAEKVVKIPHRPDDPKLGKGDLLLPLVVFSDFQCPACRLFDKQLKETILPAFDNLVRVYWKHLPWSTDCNPYSKRNLHPQACEAAEAAEAARELGGNDAFWAAHDWIYEHQRDLPKMDFREVAKVLKLDPDKFIEKMHSDETKQRIREDIELAKKLGVEATPTIYLWGRKVDRRMLMNSGFTKQINARFANMRNRQLALKKWDSMSPEEQQEMIKKVKEEKEKEGEKGPENEEHGLDNESGSNGQ